jgi:multimeric flavodoxin WrbA
MHVIVLHGSPHRGGNSDTLAASFLSGLHTAATADVRHFYANDMSIRPCQGCERCSVRLPDYCAVSDDMQQIYQAFVEADVVVFTMPMYWGYMTAQLKAVMDRLEAVTDYFRGKTFVVLITYRHHAQSTVAFFERVCPFFGVALHVVTCRTTDENENDIPISRCPDSLREAFDLGTSLATESGAS